jgi:hypothetical protein
LGGRLVQVRRDDLHALLGETDSRRAADVAGGRTGDEGNLVLQSTHSDYLLSGSVPAW